MEHQGDLTELEPAADRELAQPGLGFDQLIESLAAISVHTKASCGPRRDSRFFTPTGRPILLALVLGRPSRALRAMEF